MKQLLPEMAAGYNPKEVESGWYPWWENEGFFRPASDTNRAHTGKKFVIITPPPNVTGYLHLGHALTGAVQDTLIRYHRMKGDNTLYLPGFDHAGIATQVVVEKRLMKEEGLSRHDLGREEFLRRVWDFKNSHAGMIAKQFRGIGLSLDWTREHFTMDEQCAKAVTEAFVRMHEDGLVCRSTRLVNWCCALQSAISDLEVEFDDVEKNAKLTVPNYNKKVEMGVLTHVAYKLDDSNNDEEIVIATTRPETILGDVAVAVHPEDPRYTRFHGKRLRCPFREDTIPVVLDSTLVDMNFGTGAVKITPAHDPNDFEAGVRHNLPQMIMMDLKGYVCVPGPFHGMHRFDCRREIVKKLDEMKLLRNIEPYEYRVGRCSRTGDIVEPLLMPQWFIDCTEMARQSVEAVKNKALCLYPTAHEQVWFHWLENIKPWCVSRQLWWGHRIPAYKVQGPIPENHPDPWIVARNVDEARAKAMIKFNLTEEQMETVTLEQDPDVLDTWFSSALWPYSTLGWPNNTDDMQRFFPTSLMETGHDIIFFWVARMVMTSLHLTKQLPFHEVFFHAMVRDKNGEKMSKSKGNVIDPLFIINGVSLEELHQTVINGNLSDKEVEKALKQQNETYPTGIPECGSDALRFGLLSYTQSGRNVNLDIARIVSYRQFCNKLWNVVRYILYHALGTEYVPLRRTFESPSASQKEKNVSTGTTKQDNDNNNNAVNNGDNNSACVNSEKDHVTSTSEQRDAADELLPLECRWILSRLDTAVEEATRGMTEGCYDFALTTNAVYRFWLYELCDVFLELSKPTIQNNLPNKQLVQDTLLYVVEAGLRLLHPMMPFLTEELWHRLPHYSTFATQTIMLTPYPETSGWASAEVDNEMSLILDIVHNVRSTKASYSLTNKHRPDVWLVARSPATFASLNAQQFMVSTLGIVGIVHVITPEDVEEKVAKGCGFSAVNKDVGVHMMLRGFIDVEKEITSLEKELAKLTKQIEGLQKKMTVPNYETKVPEKVRNDNYAKMESLRELEVHLKEGIEKMRSIA